MDREQFIKLSEYFLKLVRLGAGVSEELPQKPSDVLWKDVYTLSKNHSLTAITYQAVKKTGETPEKEVLGKWEQRHRLAVHADTEQLFAWEELKGLAKENGCKLLAVKGINLKKLYPCSSLRQMGDIDVLYERADFDKIKTALENVGYTYEKATSEINHQVFKRPPVMDLEMHRDLFPDDNPFYAYYANPWSRAKETDEPSVYAFSLEDEYIYTVLHAGKHYFSYGSGVRTFLDLYLYLTRYRDELDFAYIERELQKADEIARFAGGKDSVLAFERQAREIANGWFAEEKISIDETGLSVLSGGVYGVLERGWKKAYEKQGKKYLWKRLFPPYKLMCKRNPILKKLPFLLPFFWIGRMFKGLGSKTARREYRVVKEQSKQNKKNSSKA